MIETKGESSPVLSVPTWEQLSPEQQAQVNGIGWPDDQSRAVLKTYPSIDAFRDAFTTLEINNFPLYFGEEGSFADFYRRVPVFKRLDLINPELVSDLIPCEATEHARLADDSKVLRLMYGAHTIMSNLVHIDDPGVRNGDGKIDMGYLTR